ncbi:MAG: MopE-related protein, partial [Myxococcaceae bacterium]
MKSAVVLDAGCEDCVCTPGVVEACYPGPEGTEGVSACVGGQRTCDDASQFGPCVGAVIPAAELCNGLDDDCDVAVDEDFSEEACGVGACRVTVATCVDGGVVACEPLRPAVREFCEGTDDDCDGEVDEGCACLDDRTQPCFSGAPDVRGIGRCADGTQTCSSGAWGTCAGEVLPGTEQCNGADDDCDALTDESDPLLGAACSTGLLGICAAGTNACTTGQLTCAQTLQPAAEVCNGRDDNCDGQVDEGSPGAGLVCTTGLAGVCSKGFTACEIEAVVCVPETPASAELCDGQDNDCDGISDEGNPGSGQACSTGLL